MKIHLPDGYNELPTSKTPEDVKLDPDILEAIYTNKDQDLKSLSEEKTVLLIFLRHFGCSFCREAMNDLSLLRHHFEHQSVEMVLVHMADDNIAEEYFEKYHLSGVSHISDPDLSLYEYFGLHKGTFWQLYGLKTWLRGLSVGWLGKKGLEVDEPRLGKTNQMPGVFLIKDSRIVHKFVHRSAADRPDYKTIVSKGKNNE